MFGIAQAWHSMHSQVVLASRASVPGPVPDPPATPAACATSRTTPARAVLQRHAPRFVRAGRCIHARWRDSAAPQLRDPATPNPYRQPLAIVPDHSPNVLRQVCGNIRPAPGFIRARMLKVLLALVLALQLPVVESAPTMDLQVIHAAWLGLGLALGLVGLGVELEIRIRFVRTGVGAWGVGAQAVGVEVGLGLG